jgi:phage tail-like protein
VVILESNPAAAHSVLHRVRGGRSIGSVSLERALAGRLAANPDRPPLAVEYGIAGHDLAFVPDSNVSAGSVRGTLFVAARSGNQAFAFRVDDDAYGSPPGNGAGIASTPDPQYFPMRLFSGNAVVAAGGAAYYDIGDRWVRLARQPRPRFALEGSCVLPAPGHADGAFDGKEPGCVWHRVFVDACVPPDCEVTIESRAADRPDLLGLAAWRQEPRPYRRHTGGEIPYLSPTLPGHDDRTGTWEVLMQDAIGRYLQLRVTLRGSGRSTPRVGALRAYYPRFSYLREYLPAVYREDAGSASFLDRYLANVEGFYTAIEDRIEASAALFDSRLVPPEYLDWLAGWMSATLDPAWTDDRRRFFLANAWRMFHERGTVHGIVRAIRLTLDACVDDTLFSAEGRQPPFAVRIVERFQSRRAPGVPPKDAAALHRRYAEFLRARYPSLDALNAAWNTQHAAFDAIRFGVAPEGDRRRAADWRRFVAEALEFPYVAPLASDEPWFRDFLSARYRHIADFRRAYNLDTATGRATFADIPLPAAIPDAGPAFRDWIDFASIVLPARRGAHRFTVLVPVRPSEPHDARHRKMEMARRVAAREKPTHTDFDVSPYWALFRVGEGRLGADSELGDGSRVTAIELSATALGDGFIQPAHPWDVHDRMIAGRERFGGDRTGGTPAVLEH